MALTEAEKKEMKALEQELAPQTGLTPEEEMEMKSLEQELAPKQSRPGEAALQSFGDAATFGYLPQLQALAQKPLQAGYELVTGKDLPDESYVQSRDRFSRRGQALQEENPVASLGGTVAGSVALPGITMGKGVGLLSKFGRAGAAGAATGALYNPGDEEGKVSGLQLGERLEAAKGGAKTGLIFGGLGIGAEKGLSKFSKASKGAADSLALDAIGAKKAHVKKLLNKDNIDDVARFVRDEKIAVPGESFEGAATRAKELLNKTGKEIGESYKLVERQVNDPKFLNSLNDNQAKRLFETEFVTQNIFDDIMSSVKDEFKAVSKGPQAIRQVQQSLAPMKNLGDVTDFEQLLKFRRSLDDTINFDKSVRDMPQAQKALVKARNLLKDKIDQRIKVIDEVVGGDTSKRLKELNKKYNLASEVSTIVNDKIAGEQANRRFGLTDTLLGTAGASVGAASALASGDQSPENVLKRAATGGAVALGSRALRRHGPSAATGMLNKAGKASEKASGLINPGLIAQSAEKIKRRKKDEKSK